MATYLDFIASLPSPRRFVYLCGDSVLVEDALDRYRAAVGAEAHNRFAFTGDDQGAVWDSANQYPLDPDERRIVVVRDAHKLKSWAPCEPWLKSSRVPNNYLVMVGNVWHTEVRPELRAYVVRSKQAHYVECLLPKGDPEKKAAEIFMEWGKISKPVAEHLAERTGCDLAAGRDMMGVASALGVEVTKRAVDTLVRPNVSATFIESLLGGHKADALVKVGAVRGSEMGVIAELEARTVLLGSLHKAVARQLTHREVASRMGLPETTVRRWLPMARGYERSSVIRRLTLLTRLDAQVRRGARVGVLETLVASW